jgi:L-erythro-3,5-diaminohexanoate dehydrogenase
VLIDADEQICQRARDLNLCHRALRVDLRDAVQALARLEDAGVPRSDVTVVVVNATDCEAAAILLTANEGTVLFFSMATSFTKAALGAEGMASAARMLVGSGYAPDRGAYALELVSRDYRLERALVGG